MSAAATLAESIGRALEQPSLCAAFQVTAAANAERPALRTFGEDGELTWGEYGERVRSVATGLAALGVRAGDTVGIMLAARTEFHLVDTAALHLGALPFSIYNTNPPDRVAALIENSGARVVVTEPAFAGVLAEVGAEQIVVIGDDVGPGTLTLAELEALDAPAGFDFERAWESVTPETSAMIVYTSGTTGEPKGVEWTHASVMFHLRGMHRVAPVSPEGRMISHLPMAHIAERYQSHYGSMAFGYTLTSCPDLRQLLAAVAETRPTRFFTVPRTFEKLAGTIRELAAGDPELRATIDAGVARYAGSDDPVDFHVAGATPEARALAPLREQLGLDRIEWLTAGGAASPRDVLELFAALGLPLVELWGMSETLLALSNDPSAIRMGTVGKAAIGVEASLADDGELLIRGPMFSHYRKDPQRTREAFDAHGWLKTGDVATVDADGYYRIVDRKKEIIINSAGKNMAPTLIEGAISRQSPVIAQPVAIGDGRPHVAALIVLDEEGVQQFAAAHGLSGSHAELAASAEVRAEVAAAIERANATLTRVEEVRSFRIVEEVWQPGGEELTPNMKLKRRGIAAKYASVIEGLYR
jgi:long-subunit acyl-CoA synthetase (AMP-forming)